MLDPSLPVPLEEQARAVVEGTMLGDYDPARWKHDEPKSKIAQLTLVAADAKALEPIAERAALVTSWVNRARDLVNSPPNEVNPEALAARAAEIASSQEHVESRGPRPRGDREAGHGRFRGRGQGQRHRAAARRAPLRAAEAREGATSSSA